MIDKPKIPKYQALACGLGLILLVSSLVLAWHRNPIGILACLGSLGWFALSLMMSPQVRGDLFGTRFEADQSKSES